MSWSQPNRTKPVPFWSSLVDDIRAHVSPEDRPTNARGWVPVALKVAISSAGFRAVLTYRVSHTVRTRLGPFGKPASRACFWFGRHWYSCAIASTARLYGGLIFPHPQGIVVGGDAVVGPGSWIFQNVTLGGVSGTSGMPQVGCGARIFAGAVLVGPVVVGDNVRVGANTVVTKDVPDGGRVRAAHVRVDTERGATPGHSGEDKSYARE